MFSTNPTNPTASTFALRPASAAISPITVPAPPMSHFMSSMPPAGLIEIPPVSNVTPLPMNASGLSRFLPRPEHLDLHAELGQLLATVRHFRRVQHVRRLAHQVARQEYAIGHAGERL